MSARYVPKLFSLPEVLLLLVRAETNMENWILIDRGSDYSLTIATEEFVHGGGYYLPGASLFTFDNGFWNGRSNLSQEQDFRGDYYVQSNWGQLFELSNYTTVGSKVAANISATAQDGKSWDNLTFSDCQAEYGLYGASCNGLLRHRDLILIIDKPGGWVRNDMWHLMENQTNFWDSYVPPNTPNHLFFYTTCSVVSDQRGSCSDTCRYALGRDSYSWDYDDGRSTVHQWPLGYPFFSGEALEFVNGSATNGNSHLVSGLQPGTFNLSVKYCLARPIESTCHVGMSPVLLLTVVLCLTSKTGIAILVALVLGRDGQKPLVTLGDYIASAIEGTDYETSEYPVLSITDPRGIFFVPEPRRWQVPQARWMTGIPRAVWALSYVLFAIAIAICAYLFSTTVGPVQTLLVLTPDSVILELLCMLTSHQFWNIPLRHSKSCNRYRGIHIHLLCADRK